eukprot:tig00000980_g6155.t1
MHHGFYGLDGKAKKDHKLAQIDMIEETLRWAAEAGPHRPITSVLGCGVGGSARHIARKFGATAKGVTLSGYQARRANELAREEGLEGRCEFEVGDALALPYPDASFDLVWSMEAGEHIQDKARWLSEMARVLKPGGLLAVALWCHRDVEGSPLRADEEALLGALCADYHLPYLISIPQTQALAEATKEAAGRRALEHVATADWTDAVQQFWPAVLMSAVGTIFKPRQLLSFIRSGTTVRGALAMRHMIGGYNKGVIKFGMLRAIKVE